MNKPELSLEDRVALVTGASGGIGRAIAALFGRAGATLFLNGALFIASPKALRGERPTRW
jgi:NAD(P)-dependent dehydrogenase (short-subunit alcohol dehydrogenase family)